MKIALLLLLMLLGSGCKSGGNKVNQTTVSHSGDNQFTLVVKVYDRIVGHPGWWRPSVTDKAGNVIFLEADNIYIGSLNIYWGWHADNEFWIYNSDDASVGRYTIQGGVVSKSVRTITECPEWILPDYAKSKVK
jgi:hypothetical protein